jgi:hypothetical protein
LASPRRRVISDATSDGAAVCGTASIWLRGSGVGEEPMATPSLDELKRMARETFGRELSDAQAEAYRGRLPTMVQNVHLLRDRERRLGTTDPAQVQQVGGGHG